MFMQKKQKIREVNKMSIQRAKINCQRCYEFAEEEGPEHNQYNLDNRIYNDNLWEARNEALRALESAKRDSTEKFSIPRVIDALNECVRCDYSKPSIRRYIEKFAELK